MPDEPVSDAASALRSPPPRWLAPARRRRRRPARHLPAGARAERPAVRRRARRVPRRARGPAAGPRRRPAAGQPAGLDRRRTRAWTATTASGSFTSNEATLALSQTLFNWSQFAGLDRADALVAQAEANLAAAEQGLITRVAEAYFEVLSAEDGLRFAQAEKKAIERQLEQARQRFEVGLIPVTDVKEAQASYDLAVAREIDAQNRVENAREALRSLTGQPPGSLAIIAGELRLERPEPARPAAWVERALEQNPELPGGALGGRGLAPRHPPGPRRLLPRRRADRQPHRGREPRRRRADGRHDHRPHRRAAHLVAVSSGFSTQSQTREARARFEQSQSGVVQARRAAEQGTRDAYRAVEASISRVEALRQAVESNQRRGRGHARRLRGVGTRTAVDVLNALRDLYAAQRDLADARYNYITSRLRLQQATGTLTVDEVRLVNSWLSEDAVPQDAEPGSE
ncbi:MAG: TolC family protein [Halofilum sp. (in: g-proteobacteria)]|nr:TolC family protein [Halofilum sp. (in: g-proteobacteria)]